MPSWNIHIAHAEDVLARGGGLAAAVRDRNAFLFGNVIPDIRVGYMVPGIVDPIPYRITHFAKPEHIPKPREWEFWDTYVVPTLAEGMPSGVSSCPLFTLEQELDRTNRVHYPQRYADAAPAAPATDDLAASEPPSEADVSQSVRDMVLGTWLHLLADNVWNVRVNEHLDLIGGKPSEGFRIKKQGDFSWFGKTLALSSIVRATGRLTAAAERFPQYPISRDEVLYTTAVIHETVRENPGSPEHPPFQLLNDEFFASTFARVGEQAEQLFAERTRG